MQNLQTAAVKIGMDLGVFRCLAESGEPLSVGEISQKTKAEPQLAS